MKQKVRFVWSRVINGFYLRKKKKKEKLSFIPIRLKENEQFFLLRRNMLLNIKDHNYKILICKYITSD